MMQSSTPFEPWRPSTAGFIRAAFATIRAQAKIGRSQTSLRILRAAVSMVGQLFRQKVSDDVYLGRNCHCLQCPIYDHRYQTCGSPDGDIGCHCYMPWKARLEVNCWAFRLGQNFGWPHELNSHPGPELAK